jgi:hypothetical protein
MNPTVRTGIEAAALGAREKVVYVELDFVPGYEFRGGHFDREVWGGLGLVVTGPERAEAYRVSPSQWRYEEAYRVGVEREHLRAERNALVGERDALVAELERHRGWLEDVQGSASWRMSAPLRRAKRGVSRLRHRP